MPDIPVSDLIPQYTWHWTTILHYLLLLGTIALLTTASDQASLIFTLVLAALGLLIAVDLYANLIRIPLLILYLIRILIFIIPVITAGMGGNEATRQLSVGVAIIAFPLLVLTFASGFLGPFGDPRWQF
ncbi:MAG: hypothetical protein JXJ17_04075 [Anaerolineae bacterium]|nr:hypothetical protein [Anaerolineae bacterium]